MNALYRSFLFIILLLLLTACQKKAIEQPDEKILVNIDDKVTISVNEFLRRAEYTVRPPYARDNNYLTKKVILNSLIAEKFLALEAGQDNEFLQSEEIKLFIKGRKEQAMRQWMHNKEATQLVKTDSTELKKYFPFTGREYEISYFMIPDSLQSENSELLKKSPDFDKLFHQIYSDTTAPQRKVSWHVTEDQHVLDALYSRRVSKNEVLSPIPVDGGMLYIKVLGWTDTKAITANQVQQRFDKIRETLTTNRASIIWQDKVAGIMRGKTLDFNEPVFWKLTDLFYNLYFATPEKRIESIKEQIWDVERDPEQVFESLADRDILNQPFLTVDGNTWTVADFRRELISHPLVYRNRKMNSKDYAKEFRLAIADMVRDKYVTEEAYKKNYDKVNIVQRNTRMWQDALLAVYQKNKILNSIGENRDPQKSYMAIIGDHLNSYVDSLQNKYYRKVKMDFKTFENIALSSIDLYVKQRNQPFQQVVPFFPVITTDHMIEYIDKME